MFKWDKFVIQIIKYLREKSSSGITLIPLQL